MTFSYSNECGSVKNLGNFWHLLFIWKASVYKIVWVDLCIFLFLYYSFGLAYNILLEGTAKGLFEEVCHYCASQMSFIPLSFVLGFYVSIVIYRWDEQFACLPISDYIAIYVTAGLRGTDTQSRLMKRTIMRYVNASYIMLMMGICTPVQRRFPSLDHLVVSGMLVEAEKKVLQSTHDKLTTYNIYWMPLMWAVQVVCTARQQNLIASYQQASEIIQEINKFHHQCELLLNYHWATIPLIYTQVVTWAVYTFFLAALLGRQVLRHGEEGHSHAAPGQNSIDIYFPIFTILQFMFYMGWLKVAEVLINPFGDDDDDFEINWIIDRNLQISFAIIDDILDHVPEMVKDKFWDQIIPDILPYSDETDMKAENAPVILPAQTSMCSITTPKSLKGKRKRKHLQERRTYWKNLFASTGDTFDTPFTYDDYKTLITKHGPDVPT